MSKASPQKQTTKAPKLSPLLRFGLEVLEHGLWHFFRSETTLDMKFAILHVDQAIELFLKAKVLDAGRSIYRPKSKETLGIWDCFDIIINELKCPIPQKADLELLHDERNKIQHGTASPSSEDTAYLIERSLRFADQFLRKEFKEELRDHVSSEHLDDFDIDSV